MLPCVYIKLKPHLRQFINHNYGECPKLSEKHPLSPVIYPRLLVKNTEVDIDIQDDFTKLELSTSHATNIFKYNYIDPDSFDEINDFAEELIFYPSFYVFIQKQLFLQPELELQDAIYAFIDAYDLMDFIDFETLKKRFYRFRKYFEIRCPLKNKGQLKLFY